MFVFAALVICACGQPSNEAKIEALKSNLGDMRKAIKDYRAGKGHPPASLDELVRAHYLRAIPNDPFTGKPDWRVTIEQPVHVDDFQTSTAAPAAGGIVDVRSAASGTDGNGRPWSDY